MSEVEGMFKPDEELTREQKVAKEAAVANLKAETEMVMGEGGRGEMSPKDARAHEEILKEIQDKAREAGIVATQDSVDSSAAMVTHSKNWRQFENKD